jgi:parallel beta-helix repeat protein
LTEQTYDWCTGEGTLDNPYIIEDVEIDAGGIGSGILVENSLDHFIIRNCEITNSVPEGPTWHAKIEMQNVTNGILEGNNCSGYGFIGIYLVSNCSNNIIRNNLIIKNSDGFYGIGMVLMDGCFENTIVNNYVDSNGGTNTGFGIVLYNYSYANFILDNKITNNNTLTFNDGILILKSFNNSVINNQIFKNTYGIVTRGSASVINKIFENQILNNLYGIHLDFDSNNITVKKNTIKGNNIGVEVDSSCGYNNFYQNCFIENALHSFDNGFNNSWDNGIVGNYWDDYIGLDSDDNGIGDIPHNITGTAGSQDYHPLMRCPSSDQNDRGISIELVILISAISGGVLIGIASFLLIRRKRKRLQ